MKKLPILLLGSMLCALPLAACGHKDIPVGDTQEESAQKVFPPLWKFPEAGEQEPELPEEPETPALPEEPAPIPTAEYVRILASSLNVRTGAGTSYASLGTAEKGVLLHLGKKTGSWYETVYRGKTAFVSAEEKYTALYTMTAADEKIEAVIDQGLKHLGTPYVYGAVRLMDGRGNFNRNFTTDKFDCSSLMQYIFYYGAGVKLDVTTRTQIGQGTHVDRANLKRGDLMFFTNASRKNNKGLERVGHVALYLGDNYILHTASDYAKIEQISATRWSYFIEGRRII